MMKRMIFAISLMAVLNLMALGAGGVMAWKKGWLDKERVHMAVSILRGEDAENIHTSESAEGGGHDVKGAAAHAPIQQAGDKIREGSEAEERMRIEFARREREIQDGFRLWESRQLALLREKESLEEEKRRFAAEREQLARADGDSGVQKEKDTLAGIPAKSAKELLMAKTEAEAASILKTMEQRKLNKIVKECKTEEERLWIGRIMSMFTDSSTAKAETIDEG